PVIHSSQRHNENPDERRSATGQLRTKPAPHVRQRAHGRGHRLGGWQRALPWPDADQHETRRTGQAPAPDRQLQEAARGAGQGCRAGRLNMASERPVQEVAALMLAAGYSRRFGGDKRRVSLADGRSLLAASLALPCAMLEDVWLVLRPEEAPAELALPTDVRVVQNPATALGMGHSLAAGAERLLAESNADAVAIFLADMPLIRRDSLETLIAHASTDKIVLPSYHGTRGHPVLFGRDFWPQL